MELNTDMIDLCFKKSTEPRKQEIKGELYVTKSPSKKNSISKLKNKLLELIALALVGGFFIGAMGIGGTIDNADIILKEINAKYTYMDPFGDYVTKHVYSDEFRNEMNELNCFELMNLFNNTSSEMKDEGLKEESKSMEDVVKRMSVNYNNTKDSHK